MLNATEQHLIVPSGKSEADGIVEFNIPLDT